MLVDVGEGDKSTFPSLRLVPPFLPEKSIDRWSRWNVEGTLGDASDGKTLRSSSSGGSIRRFVRILFESLEILEKERKEERLVGIPVYCINVWRGSVLLFGGRKRKWRVFRILLVEYFVTILFFFFFVEKGCVDPDRRWAAGWSAVIDTVLSPDDSAIRSHIRSKGPCILIPVPASAR